MPQRRETWAAATSRCLPSALRDGIDAVVADLEPQLRRQHARMEVDVPSAAGIACDPVLLQILLRNLIDNALLHAGPGVRILIQTRRAEGELQLAVRDDGPGIAADQRELALQPFHRLDSQVRSGAGLGLAIVQRIARASGARLCLEDGIGDRGLEVVLFPVAAWPGAEVTSAPCRPAHKGCPPCGRGRPRAA